VAVIGPADIWAVGTAVDSHDPPLTEHWDGQTWTFVPSAAAAVPVLNGVAVDGTGTVWAVGRIFDQSRIQTLILRYSCAVPACTIQFSDVTDPTTYYYAPVQYLACRGVVSGYNDGTFRPFNNTTRGQMTKIVTWAFGIPQVQLPVETARTFTDVLPDAVFYAMIETAATRGIVGGYACGGYDPQTGAAEPCDSQQRAYFRPAAWVTRGQLSKIVVIGAGWAVRNPPVPTFSDVPAGSTFYTYVETAVCHGMINGYSDGTFHPNNNAFRGQIAKIVYFARGSGTGCGPAATPVSGIR
jgi:hypothetical protein